jgi:hypothetical protein
LWVDLRQSQHHEIGWNGQPRSGVSTLQRRRPARVSNLRLHLRPV